MAWLFKKSCTRAFVIIFVFQDWIRQTVVVLNWLKLQDEGIIKKYLEFMFIENSFLRLILVNGAKLSPK